MVPDLLEMFLNSPNNIAKIVSQILGQNNFFLRSYWICSFGPHRVFQTESLYWQPRKSDVSGRQGFTFWTVEFVPNRFEAVSWCQMNALEARSSPRAPARNYMIGIFYFLDCLLDWQACPPLTSRQWKVRVYLNFGFCIIFICRFHNNYYEFRDTK